MGRFGQNRTDTAQVEKHSASAKMVERRFAMPKVALAVPAGISRRIEKLARDAGRTPAQMLKFVLRDGLEHTEYAVKEANSGLAELDAGTGIPLAAIKQRAEDRRQRRGCSSR